MITLKGELTHWKDNEKLRFLGFRLTSFETRNRKRAGFSGAVFRSSKDRFTHSDLKDKMMWSQKKSVLEMS